MTPVPVLPRFVFSRPFGAAGGGGGGRTAESAAKLRQYRNGSSPTPISTTWLTA